MSAHVLLIESDALLRGEIVKYLINNRHRVTACGSVAEASAALAGVMPAVAPDAIMSGVFLPDGDGLSFFLKASGRFPEMRWILTTTGCEEEESMVDELSPPGWVPMRREGVGARRRKAGG